MIVSDRNHGAAEAQAPIDAPIPRSSTQAVSVPTAPRRRRWPLITAIVVGVVLILGLVAVIVGESQLRTYAENEIRQRVSQELGLESASDVSVDLGSSAILPQALRGRLDTVTVAASGVDLDRFSGDITFTALGVSTSSGKPVSRVDIAFRIPESEATELAIYLSGVDLDRVGFSDAGVEAAATLSVLGISVPAAMTLEPGVSSSGLLTFDPTTITAAGATVSADELRAGPLGPLAAKFLKQQTVCVAQGVPAGVVLSSAHVEGDTLALRFHGDDVILGRGKGTCP